MSYLLDYNPGTRQYTYPRRGGAQLSGTCIIHTAECAADNVGEDLAAETCASFIANRADYGSYHRLVDSDSIIDMLPWEYEAWQDSETNNWAVGISAALRTTDWSSMPTDRADRVYRNMAACAADFVRYMSGKGVSVPLRRITGAEARRRVPGFCAHGDSGVSRSDPGTAFDWARFFAYTEQALGGGITAQSTNQEDELSAEFEADARGEFDELRSFRTDVRGAIAEINRETDGLEAFIVDVRGDLANKGAQLSAQASAIRSLTELLGKAQGLDVEQVRAAVAAAIADGIKLTVEVK